MTPNDVLELEMDELNQHECMATMTALIKHMQRYQILQKEEVFFICCPIVSLSNLFSTHGTMLSSYVIFKAININYYIRNMIFVSYVLML